MARRGLFTRDHAEKIASKLKAVIQKRSAHDVAVVYYEGRRVIQFGIRRSSRRDKGHDHLPGDLFLSPHDVRRLADCPMSYGEWVQRMKDLYLIRDEEPPR